MDKEEKLHNLRHTTAHIMAHAVLNLYGPKVKFGIGPVIENGFYYDFDLPKPLSEQDLPRIEEEMKKLIKENLLMKREEYSLKEALKMMRDTGQSYKIELLKEIWRGKRKKVKGVKPGHITFYRVGNFFDLCKGGHLKSTKEIPPEAFKITHIAGAYWKGSEKNPMLTRIYGAAFATKKELDNYLTKQKESKERDHKKLGAELDIFTFSDLVGPGLPLWTPKGTLIRNLLDDFVWKLRKERSYEKVEIPHLAKKELYMRSGHWEKFKNELFRITTREKHEFAMKPMNCPHHVEIYKRHLLSYRELPQRYANTTMCYRDEQTGELAGLLRVRSFTQDDAHVFCRYSQIKEEFAKIWDIVDAFYRIFGFKLKVRLSFRDPKQPQQFLGGPSIWKKAENILRAIARKRKVKAVTAVGEAAFYGPKVDFLAKDSLNREWQIATIQLDMNMPERFNLVCINEQGQPERIAMLHAAIMGSIERFVSILIEHFAGAFPVWLAPVQAIVLPISNKFNDYAHKIFSELRATSYELRIQIDDRNESINKKIREAEKQKIPYMLIVGKKERELKTVAVRQRGEKDLGTMKLNEFIEKVNQEITSKSLLS